MKARLRTPVEGSPPHAYYSLATNDFYLPGRGAMKLQRQSPSSAEALFVVDILPERAHNGTVVRAYVTVRAELDAAGMPSLSTFIDPIKGILGLVDAFVELGAGWFQYMNMPAANDLVAVSFTSRRSMGQDFTASRGRLLAAVDRFMGTKLPPKVAAMIQEAHMTRHVLKTKPPPQPRDPYEIEREALATTSLRVLEGMSEFLSGIRGRRKALVYFGEGIDHEMMDIINPDGVELGDTGRVRAAMRDAVAMATRSNVSVYAIDPRGLATGLEEAIGLPTLPPHYSKNLNPLKLVDEMSRSHQWMQSVTGETGGIPFLNTNDTAGPLRRIVDDSSS